MVKYGIDISALEIGKASLIFEGEPCIVKLSYEQAMTFSRRFTSFEEMLDTYGKKNRLELGEYYDGYVAVYYSCNHQSVVRMCGEMHPSDFNSVMLMFDPVKTKEAAARDELYEVISPMGYKGRPLVFSLVWTFNDCEFERWAILLQENQLLPKIVSPYEIDVSLKRKLTRLLVNNEPLVCDPIENVVLFSYAPDYFFRFFTRLKE